MESQKAVSDVMHSQRKAYNSPAAVVDSVSVVITVGADFAASLLACFTRFTLQ